MLLIGGPKQFGRKEPSMMIIGCDYHPSWQQICWLDTVTGETGEKKLEHASGEAEKFYRGLPGPALIGMESTGNCQWFVEMAAALGHDVWIGDAAKIRAADLRQLLIHRYKLVRIRAQVKTELQHLAMNQGVTKKRKLWSKAGEKALRELPLKPWASRRREDLFRIREMLNGQIGLLDQAVVEAAEKNEKARLLMTQPGVGPITSMAFVLTMGDVSRFQRGKQVASYLGLIPREYSSGGHRRYGSISKQGNRFMRMLLVEAAQGAVRCDPGFRSEYLHRCHRKAKGVAKVAAARKLAIRLYWMLRTNTGYPEVVRVESSSRVALVVRHGG